MDLTNSFTARMYFLNGIGKDAMIDVMDSTFYLGCGKPGATVEEVLNSVKQGQCANISYQDGQSEKTKLADAYISLRQLVNAKNLVALLSRAANVEENTMAINYILNSLQNEANPEDVYVGDDLKNKTDEWGMTPNKRYSPSYEEIKKIYAPEVTK